MTDPADTENPETLALRARIAELEAHVGLLEERWALNEEVDGLAEIAIRDRLPLDHALRSLMPALARATGGRLVFVRTYDETLSLHDYVHSEDDDSSLPFDPEALVHEVAVSDFVTRAHGRSTLVGQRIDVAGEHFGTAAVLVPASLDRHASHRVAQLLDTWCEEIDNHLAAIAESRRKAILTQRISDALKDPVLDRGIDRAIEVLRENVPFEVLLLVFRHEDDTVGDTLRFKLLRTTAQAGAEGEAPAVDHTDDDAALRSRAYRIMGGDDSELRELLGVQRYREELLITGARSTKILGRLLVASRRGEFNTFDRDLLERFADSLRQRIVDFNREWRNLKTTFSKPMVDRLLSVEGYREKFLTPREQRCAVMFADISGFTRLSEQILVKPESIGRFVDLWSEAAVDAVWDTGGVFDKMVGDCVIAIWGPPFFDLDPADACRRALEASARIREHTRSMIDHPDMPELAQMKELDVAIGLHFCPLFVGVFGPDQDYTGFSAGMNNTARLQGQAKGGEILCMEQFLTTLASSNEKAIEDFGEERQAMVKNVAEPLRFRAWVGTRKEGA